MTELSAPIALACGFEPPNYETWRKLVEKALHGADFDRKLVARTADGLQINPLYTRADALAAAQAAVPGAAPFTRGTTPRSVGLGWHIHQRVVAPDAGTANEVILEELEGGASGVVLQIAAPGQTGIAIAGASDMAAALAGVYLDYASVQLAGGIGSVEAARNFLGALELLKSKPGEAASCLNVDPIGTLARFGTAGTPITQALGDAMKLAHEARASGANVVALAVDATVPHEAGASEAQELAYLAATLTAYLRAFEAVGVSPSDAFAHDRLRACRRYGLVPRRRQAARRAHDHRAHRGRLQSARRHDAHHGRHVSAHDGEARSVDQHAAHDGCMRCRRLRRSRRGHRAALHVGARCARSLRATRCAQRPARAAGGILARPRCRSGGRLLVRREAHGRPCGEGLGAVPGHRVEGAASSPRSSRARCKTTSRRVAQARAKAVATGRLELTGVSVFPLLGDDGVKVVPLPEPAPVAGKPEVRPLAPHRLAEPFEDLRDRADAYAAKGARARVFLANLGEIAEHNRRSTWTWNLLAAGGIEGLTSDGYRNAAEAAAAFKKSGARIACICSSDAVYAAQAKDTAKALKSAGASRVLLAGKPGEDEAALRAAGVDGFLQAGQDAIAALKELQKSLGIA